MKKQFLAVLFITAICDIISQTKNQGVVLITGAASGIGRATALEFVKKGFITYATDKDTINLKSLSDYGCKILYLDVTIDSSMVKAVLQIEKENGAIDILVNNAGYGQYGTIEQTNLDKIRKQYDVNVFGLIRMSQLVLPGMRKNRSGRIINVGSTVGDYTLPAAGIYCSTKYAVESISDAMRMELRQFGIKVIIIKPAAVNTNFTSTAKSLFPKIDENDPYFDVNKNFVDMITTEFNPKTSRFKVLSPEQVAEKIVKSAQLKRPKTRYKLGFAAKTTPFLKRILGPKGFDKFMLMMLGISTKTAK
jgi:short-subunit dehydrogenase